MGVLGGTDAACSIASFADVLYVAKDAKLLLDTCCKHSRVVGAQG